MATVRSLRVSVKPDSGSDSDSESDKDAREAEPMEVEDGELEDEVSVSRSLKELLPDTSRRYENKAGSFITGIDVNSKEAIERKEKRAQRFHFRPEDNAEQRDVLMDKETMKKAIPNLRMEALYVTGVDDMSTQDIFGYFKDPEAGARRPEPGGRSPEAGARSPEPGARSPEPGARSPEPGARSPEPGARSPEAGAQRPEAGGRSPEAGAQRPEPGGRSPEPRGRSPEVEDLSLTERDSLLSNELRPAIKPFKGNKLLLRFATHDDKKELGAARRSRYYMKYGNPNYGGMRGVLSNSWKRRFHTRRIQRDYGDRVGERGGASRSLGAGLRGRQSRSPSPWSESDEMDYDLELKMISTPSPKKTKKMTMYADELDTTLKSIRNRVGGSKSASPPPKVRDVRQLLEEKCEAAFGEETIFPRWTLPRPPSPRDTPPAREPIRDVHRRLGVANQDRAVNSSKDRKSTLWSRLGSAGDDANERLFTPSSSSGRKENASSIRRGGDGEEEEEEEKKKKKKKKKKGAGEEEEEEEEEDDSALQEVWGAMIKQKQERLTTQIKKSRLDNLPSLQIEISRESSDESDN
ncbi:Nuclear cap-binding protein subunit 3 [Dissostichus eleginoides]|uniref:Nuclear cap-binding protein subunit 3 n=1 Tax=Dissostichus eleginoides TaxID=100907 RepID=A0AAD9B1J1_DISEL|nr:Nuclear cap-binding protein subunit 3 [Dissostichus eleginoides]